MPPYCKIKSLTPSIRPTLFFLRYEWSWSFPVSFQCCEGKSWQNHTKIWVTSEQLQVVCALPAMRWWFIPSRELTYPTWGKGKSSSKCHFLRGYVSSLEGMAWFCISFWSFVSCFLGQKLYWAVAEAAGVAWVSIHLSLWMLQDWLEVHASCHFLIWNLHVVFQDLLLFSALLDYHDQHHMVWCPTSSPKYKESPGCLYRSA